MNDDKNGQDTAKLSELFASETDASGAPAAEAEGPTTSDTATGVAAPPPTATATLPEAEPAWLHRGGPELRTTPRIRWAGIVWGLVFAAAGSFAVWTMLSAERRAAFSDWILTLNNGGWTVVGAFTIGGLLLVLGMISALRAASHRD